MLKMFSPLLLAVMQRKPFTRQSHRQMHDYGNEYRPGLQGQQAQHYAQRNGPNGFLQTFMDVYEHIQRYVDSNGQGCPHLLFAGEKQKSTKKDFIADEVKGPGQGASEKDVIVPMLGSDLGVLG